MKNTRRIDPSVSPMVRKMPMSRPLFFTSMIRPETMFIAAISTRIDRMMNITLSSMSKARKKDPAASRQVQISASSPATSSAGIV